MGPTSPAVQAYLGACSLCCDRGGLHLPCHAALRTPPQRGSAGAGSSRAESFLYRRRPGCFTRCRAGRRGHGLVVYHHGALDRTETSLQTVTVLINAPNLLPGPYSGEVMLTVRPKAGATAFDVQIPVHLTVLKGLRKAEPPEHVNVAAPLQLTPGRLDFTYRDGDPPPPPKQISVSNGVARQLRTSVPDPSAAPWLRVDVGRGLITVRIQPAGQTVGHHTAMLVVSAAGDQAAPQYVPIGLTIQPAAVPMTGGGVFRQLRWEGTLRPGEVLTIKGNAASSGELKAESLPASRVELKPLKGTLELIASPSARNGYSLQIKNKGADTESRIMIFFREAP